MSESTEAWLKSGKHLPECLRDFHDQKAVFKTIHTLVKPPENFVTPTWVEAQVYVIDTFLHFMARRGYTLQRTRRRGEYRDLAADIAALERRELEVFRAYMASRTPETGASQ